jgi:hypothetical protein
MSPFVYLSIYGLGVTVNALESVFTQRRSEYAHSLLQATYAFSFTMPLLIVMHSIRESEREKRVTNEIRLREREKAYFIPEECINFVATLETKAAEFGLFSLPTLLSLKDVKWRQAIIFLYRSLLAFHALSPSTFMPSCALFGAFGGFFSFACRELARECSPFIIEKRELQVNISDYHIELMEFVGFVCGHLSLFSPRPPPFVFPSLLALFLHLAPSPAVFSESFNMLMASEDTYSHLFCCAFLNLLRSAQPHQLTLLVETLCDSISLSASRRLHGALFCAHLIFSSPGLGTFFFLFHNLHSHEYTIRSFNSSQF